MEREIKKSTGRSLLLLISVLNVPVVAIGLVGEGVRAADIAAWFCSAATSSTDSAERATTN